MSQLYMSGYSRKGDQMGLRDSGYNETRENIYNKQKDLHKEIEIDVPELEYGQEDYQVDESSNRESMNEINNKSDVSAHILQEYKMGQIYGSQKKAMTNSRMKSGKLNVRILIIEIELRLSVNTKWSQSIITEISKVK